MPKHSHWKKANVVSRLTWSERLFSIWIDAPEIRFDAGQFVSLALPAPAGSVESMVSRPYSFVNAPGSVPHEFLIVDVPQGSLSPRLAQLRGGDSVWIGNAYGFFVCNEVPAAAALWMMATGTGIAPFLSMLRTRKLWQKFGRVVLVHGVRQAEELVYPEVIASLRREHGQCFSYAPFVSQENGSGANQPYFSGRMTTALAGGQLEEAAGSVIATETTQVMLCGHPAMVDEVRGLLEERGMRRHRQRVPGQITTEAYW